MKKVDILDTKLGMNYHDYILLETISDWYAYKTLAFDDLSMAHCKVMNSSVPNDRWDHFNISGIGACAFTTAVMKANINGGNPILDSIKGLDETTDYKRDLIERGERVVVNSNGGFFWLLPHHEIVNEECWDGDSNRDHLVCIRDNTVLLNLENDPELEQHSIDYMSERDENYSYILDMRGWSYGAMKHHFTEFKDNGGESLYVYTTAMDVPQVDMYLKLAVDCGIMKAIIELNAGTSTELTRVMDRYVDVIQLTILGSNNDEL